MEIEIHWKMPLSLIDGTDEYRVYTPEDKSPMSDRPGVYVFARKHGHRTVPLYVGKANNLAVRVAQQLNNVKLMKGIENSPQGGRLLILGELHRKHGQNTQKVLRIAESALIEHSLSQGFDILNKQGKNRPAHSVCFVGNRQAKRYSGKEIKTRANR
jgi:hypothetical protein